MRSSHGLGILAGGIVPPFWMLACILWACTAIVCRAETQFTGVQPPTKADLAWIREHARMIKSRADLTGSGRQLTDALPPRVVNIEHLPVVGRQEYGSCTSWAIVYYYKTWQEARERGWHRPDPSVNPERVMSPAFVFNLANGGDPWSGTAISTNFNYLLDIGACTCAEMDANADPRTWPTEAQYMAAFAHRGQSVAYFDMSAAGFEALKAHLASGDLATFNMGIYNNFHAYPADGPGIDSEVYFKNNGDLYFAPGAGSASHEMCIIGYDDNKTFTDDTGATRQGAMLVVNSWGTQWGAYLPEAGSTGFIWIAYDYFMGAACDTAIMEDRIGYQPTTVGTYHVTHGRIAELSLMLMGGDRDDPDWTMNVLPRTGGLRGIDATVGFDATDFASTDNLSWWLQIGDVYLSDPRFQPPATGVIDSFKIRRPDGTVWTSPDCPVETVESNLVNAYAWANIGLLQRHKTAFDSYAPAVTESVWGDVDGDEDEDAFFVSYETSGSLLIYRPRLLRNDGDWNFTEVRSGLPGQAGGMALGDYDGDGLPDLVLVGTETLPDGNHRTLTMLMHNEGQCQFRDSGIALPNAANRPEWIDYNNDGRLDLALNSYNEHWQQAGLVVLINNGNGTFTDSGLLLPNSKVSAWADYDRDGHIDLVRKENDAAVLSRNTGTDMETVRLPLSISAEAVAWGDVDNDGWLDLAVCGYDQLYARVGHVLRNDHGTLKPYATFPCVVGGGIDWGDIDNDGLADLCVWGDYGGAGLGGDKNIKTNIYRNNGDGTFTNWGFNLWPAGSVMGGNVDFVRLFDIDHDGDLDLSVCAPGRIPYPQPRKFHIFENAAAQPDGLHRPNTPPSVPSGLQETQTAEGQPIELKWDAAVDTETPAGGLFYDLRIGTNPGWCNLMPPDMSIPLGDSRLRPSLSAGQLGYRLTNPPGVPIYWAVRTIDPAQGVSPWSGTRMFVPHGATLAGDANGDSRIDIADLVTTVRMAGGEQPVDLTADRNQDGSVDLVDRDIVASILLGTANTDSRTVAARLIDNRGGTIITSGIQVGIPAGAFTEPSTIRIEIVRKTDTAAGKISPAYRIDGIPADFQQPISIQLHATQLASEDVFASIGEVSLHPSAGMLGQGYWKVPAEAAGGGDYTFHLSPSGQGSPAPGSVAKQSEPRLTAGSSSGFKLTIDVDLDNHTAIWANSHFSISFDAGVVDLAHVIALGNALEDAYKILKDTTGGGGFDYAARTNWPVAVTVHKLSNNGIFGEFVASKMGDNHGWIEINSDNIADLANVRTTAIHEFFHLVQNLYDPRYGFTKAVTGGEHLWLNEAASVWSEELLAPSGYVSPLLDNDILAPFNGMIAGAQGSSKVAQDHGYGMASLIKYLAMRRDATVLPAIFNSIKLGGNSAMSIRNCGPTATDFTWWPEYFIALIKGEIIAFGPADIAGAAPAARQFKIETADAVEKIKMFAESIPDLSARLHMAIPLYAGFDDTHRLACRLARNLDDDTLRLHLLKSKASEPTTLLGEGVAANGAWKFEVTGLQQLQAEGGWRLLPLVTNQKATDPASGKTPYELKVAVVGEGTRTLPPKTVNGTGYDVPFPSLSVSGTLQGRGWAEFRPLNISLFDFYMIDVPALPPIDYNLTLSATIANGLVTIPNFIGVEELTVSAIKQYKFEYSPESVEGATTTVTSVDGVFPFQLTRESLYCGGSIYAVFDVIRRQYDNESQLLYETTDLNQTMPIFGFAMLP